MVLYFLNDMEQDKVDRIAKMDLHDCDTCTDVYYSYEPKEGAHKCPQCIMREEAKISTGVPILDAILDEVKVKGYEVYGKKVEVT